MMSGSPQAKRVIAIGQNPDWHLLTAESPHLLLEIAKRFPPHGADAHRLLNARVRWLIDRLGIPHSIVEAPEAPAGVPLLTASPGNLGFISAHFGVSDDPSPEVMLAIRAGMAWLHSRKVTVNPAIIDFKYTRKKHGSSDGLSILLSMLQLQTGMQLKPMVCASASVRLREGSYELGFVDRETIFEKAAAAAHWGYRIMLVCRGQPLPRVEFPLELREIGPDLGQLWDELDPYLELASKASFLSLQKSAQRYATPKVLEDEIPVPIRKGKSRRAILAAISILGLFVLVMGLFSVTRSGHDRRDITTVDMVQRLFDHEQAVLDRLAQHQQIDGLIPPLLNIVDALANGSREPERWKQQASLLRQVLDGPDILTESGIIDVETWSSLVRSCDADQRLKALASIGHEAAKRLQAWSQAHESWYLSGSIQSPEDEKPHWFSAEDVATIQRWLTLRRSTQPQSASIRYWNGLQTLRTWKIEAGPEPKELFEGTTLQKIMTQRLSESLELTKIPRLSSLTEPRREVKDILTVLQAARIAQFSRRVDLLHERARDLGQVPIFSGLGKRLQSAYVDRINELLTRGQAWTFQPKVAFTFSWGEEMGASMVDYYDHAYSGTHFVEVIMPANTVLGPLTCDVHYRAGEMGDLSEDITVLPHEPFFVPVGATCGLRFYEKKPHRVRASTTGGWPAEIKDEQGRMVLVPMNEIPAEVSSVFE